MRENMTKNRRDRMTVTVRKVTHRIIADMAWQNRLTQGQMIEMAIMTYGQRAGLFVPVPQQQTQDDEDDEENVVGCMPPVPDLEPRREVM
jgi:hypothetical protein